MKQFILLIILLIGTNSYAQFGFNSYEKATLKLRNGKEIDGEAKITNDQEVKFKKGNEKEIYDYRNLESFKLIRNGEMVSYTYKIITGKKPRLLKIVREYPGRINLFVFEYNHNNNSGAFNTVQTSQKMTPAGEINIVNNSGSAMNSGVSLGVVNEYYVNKGSGHEVIKIGNDHPVFGKRHFKKTINEFFKDCPEIIRKVNENEFRRAEMVSIVDFYNENCASK